MKYFILMIALVSCKPKAKGVPDEWFGIDSNKAVCSWPLDGYNKIIGPGTCIAEGRAFLCIYQRNIGSGADRVSCAPVGTQLQIEKQ